jgi:tetratricopeptide (TPR) repeat protein
MQQGAQAMTAGNFDAAVTAYSTVTREMPNFAEGYFNLGLAQQQAGQLDDAQSSLKKALRLKPDLRGANLFLGIIAYRENRYKEADDDFERETRVDPHSAKAFMWLGVCHLAQDDPHGAIAPLDNAYALDPSDADILYHRGRAYFLVANASYAAMFKLNYDSVRVHQVLAESYAQAYRNQEAILEFELAVKMAPNLPGLHEELADQYWVMGEADKAGDNYREELRVDPYADTSMYKLGSLLVMHQNPTEGVKLLRDALRADPSLSDAHYYLAEGLTSLDQDEDAIHEFELAIAADPTNERAMSAYYRLSQLYRDRHDTANAQAAMQNFLRMRAQNKLHQTQAAAQVVRKRTELPVADPEKTAELDGQAAN